MVQPWLLFEHKHLLLQRSKYNSSLTRQWKRPLVAILNWEVRSPRANKTNDLCPMHLHGCHHHAPNLYAVLSLCIGESTNAASSIKSWLEHMMVRWPCISHPISLLQQPCKQSEFISTTITPSSLLLIFMYIVVSIICKYLLLLCSTPFVCAVNIPALVSWN